MSEDLIKRSDAIEAITNHCENECYYRIDNWCPQCQREEFQEAIKAVPSADRLQGEWIVNISDYKSMCSVCGANETHFIYGTEMWYGLGKSKFCPYCGARMKGAIDETDY